MGSNGDRRQGRADGGEGSSPVKDNFYQAVINAVSDPLFVKDRSFRLVLVNQGFADFTGYGCEEVLGKEDFDLFRPDQAATYRRNDELVFATGREVAAEEEYTDSDGVTHTVLTKKRPYRDAAGNLFLVGLARDVTELKTATELLRRSEQRFRSIFEHAAAGMAIVDPDGRLKAVNDAFCRILGYHREELLAQTVEGITHPEDREGGRRFFRDAARKRGTIFKGEKRYLHRRGHTVWGLTTATFERDEDGTPLGAVALVQEITEKKEAEEVVAHLAYHDSLTDLPNRSLLTERLRQILYQAERDGRKVGILYFDLDNFKKINDTLGHETGDLLLRAVAGRLRECVRRSDTAARLGGDEFVVVLPNLPSEYDVAAVATHLLAAMARPFRIGEREIFTSASMGITLYPDDGKEGKGLLKNADMAMYEAKEQGRNRFRFFSSRINDRVQKRVALEEELKQVLEREKSTGFDDARSAVADDREGGLFLLYQPQIDLLSGEIVAMEALVRWRHPCRGLVATTEFIEAAEETGLILDLGEWILGRLCRQNRRWQEQGLPSRRVTTNLSRAQLLQPDAAELLETALAGAGLEARWLEIELTETILQDYSPDFVATLAGIRQRGVRISVDDFGTGYTCLRHLRRYPVDRIKVAHELVARLPEDDDAAAVVEAILAMAAALGVEVVAEGVENRLQLEFLLERGCHEVQGYYFSRPLAASAMALCLERNRRDNLSCPFRAG